jgi:hypothetical protein
MSRIYYHGCVGEVGHRMYGPEPEGLDMDKREIMRWSRLCDGGLLPERGEQVEGQAIWSYARGHSIVSFWDRSVDSRGGSSSSFLLEGLYSFGSVMSAARKAFPGIFARFNFEVKKAKSVTTSGDVCFAMAVEDFRFILGATRAARGRDFIRSQQYGLLLDALDAGAEKLLGTDMDPRTHGTRPCECGSCTFFLIGDVSSCAQCGKKVEKAQPPMNAITAEPAE